MRRPRAGFTLVELTVVFAVIGILAAILFPVFNQAREAGRKADCQTRLYQLGAALQLYARDHDGKLPPAHNDFRPLRGVYVTDEQLFRCPTDSGKGASYQYRGGLSLEDRPDIPLAADWDFRHGGGGSVLYLDGHVKWIKDTNWQPVAPGPRPGGPTPGATPMPYLNDWQSTPAPAEEAE
ncbi:MAG: prepilin-type N-terminal cleavage/methylation domain-containing protein [Armatimonadota bacterium]